jgi:hypothetical protein
VTVVLFSKLNPAVLVYQFAVLNHLDRASVQLLSDPSMALIPVPDSLTGFGLHCQIRDLMLARLPNSNLLSREKKHFYSPSAHYSLMVVYEDLSVGRLNFQLDDQGLSSEVDAATHAFAESSTSMINPADHFIVPDGVLESDAKIEPRMPLHIDSFSLYKMKSREKRLVQRIVSLRHFYNTRLEAVNDPMRLLANSEEPESFAITLDRLIQTASDRSNLFHTPGFTL